MNRIQSILFLPFAFLAGHAQDSIQKNWELKGYLKDLNSVTLNKDFGSAAYTNLVHNRINFKWKPSKQITGALEIRSRVYWGDAVRQTSHFGRQLRNDNEAVNLSGVWNISNNSIFQTNIERLWMEYRRPKWNLRAGRQRVNWGMANIWNPNDIFNAYNLLDFDYEERAGCDAVKLQYLLNNTSNVELTAAAANQKREGVTAIKYATNYRGYDLQLISGIFHRRFTAGLGWAGSIGNVGYKGEAQFFDAARDSGHYINVTMEWDYFFKNGWYLNAAALYNHQGLNRQLDDWTEVSFHISPTNLMPAKWNMLLGCTKEFTPLFSGSMNVIYSPGPDLFILFPSFKYNLSSDLDIDFVWQSFFAGLQHRFQGVSHTVFVRGKWSF